MTEGVLDVQEVSTGEFQFTYVTPAGAMHVGPRLYKTERAAKAAGSKWLVEWLAGRI